jgi:hypothetical protein
LLDRGEEGQQRGGLWFFKKPGSMTSESVREGLHTDAPDAGCGELAALSKPVVQTHFIWDLCYSSPSHSLSLLELFSLISNHIAQWFFYENLLFFSEEIGLVLFMVTVETRETN